MGSNMIKASLSLAPDTVRALMARDHNQSRAIRELVKDYDELMTAGRKEIRRALPVETIRAALACPVLPDDVVERLTIVGIHAFRDIARKHALAESSGLSVDVMDFFEE